MFATKTIKEMDQEFAKEAKLTYKEFKELSIMDQFKITRKITNKRLKNQNK